MSFARWKQRQAERCKRVPVSLYSPEFQAGLRMVENTEVGSMRLAEGVTGLGTRHWEVVEAKRKARGGLVRGGLSGSGREFPSECLAVMAEELAGAASAHTHYAAHMLKLSRTQRADTVEQQGLATDLDRDVVTPLLEWIKKEATLFHQKKAEMYKRRLDMDIAVREGKACQAPHDPKRVTAEAKTRIHAEAMEKAQGSVDGLPDAHAKHLRGLGTLALVLRAYHSKNASLLTSSLFELGQDQPFPPPPPFTQLPTAAAPHLLQ